MSRFEFEVRYSEAQVRRSVWAYVRISLRRAMKWHDLLLIGCALIVFIWFGGSGRDRWWLWLGVAVLATICVFLAVMWRAYLSHSLERLARMKDPVARCVADETNLSIASDLGSMSMPWSSFTEVIDGPDNLYLKAGRGQMVTLPVEGVDPAALQFIRERVASASRS